MVAVNNTNVRITIPYVKARFLLYTCIFVCIFFIVFVSQVVERNHTLHVSGSVDFLLHFETSPLINMNHLLML